MRLRGVRGFIGRGDGREVRPLPGRAKAEDVKDWKWMFRISSNWRTGAYWLLLLRRLSDVIVSQVAAPLSTLTRTALQTCFPKQHPWMSPTFS